MNEISNKQEVVAGTSWENISQVSPLAPMSSSIASHPLSPLPNHTSLAPMPSTPHYDQVPVVVPTPIRMAPLPEQIIEHDMPPELTSQGWRKLWSKRENRPYFWNKLSGESLWEMPVLKTAFDPITDPLGICDPGAGHGPGQPVHHLKRRATEELPAVPQKRFILA